MFKLVSLYCLSFKMVFSKNLLITLSENLLDSVKREACTVTANTFKTSRILRCWRNSTYPETRGTYTECQTILLNWVSSYFWWTSSNKLTFLKRNVSLPSLDFPFILAIFLMGLTVLAAVWGRNRKLAASEHRAPREVSPLCSVRLGWREIIPFPRPLF